MADIMNILVVNGHPDPRPERFCAALCDAYAEGAQAHGYTTRRLDVGALPVSGSEPASPVQRACEWLSFADRLTIIFPLWLDGPPAGLRRFFELVSRKQAATGRPIAAEKSARVVVTTAMPAFLYRPSLQSVARGAKPDLALSGVDAGQFTFIGSVETISDAQRKQWLYAMRLFGERAS
jgi:putative NADPH-quinone reductase